MNSRPALAFAALLVGGLLGFLIAGALGGSGEDADSGDQPAAGRSRETPAPAPAPSDRITPPATSRPAPPPSPTGECNRTELDWLRERVAELEQQSGLQQAMLEGYKFEKLGKPTPFPERLPPKYRDEFEATLSKAVAEIEGDGIELVGVECKEWPCIAMLRNEDQSGRKSGLSNTETWRKSFGGTVRDGYSGFVDCGDGRKERIELTSPHWDGQADLSSLSENHWNLDMQRRREAKNFERTEWQQNLSKRLHTRWEEISSAWKCREQE